MVNLTPEQQKQFGANYVAPDPQEPEAVEQEEAQVAKEAAEIAALMTMKAALIETTNSRGWFYVLKFAETIVRGLEKAAIEEENDTIANGMRRDARGARKFKDELIRRIEMAKNQEPAHFLEVSTD